MLALTSASIISRAATISPALRCSRAVTTDGSRGCAADVGGGVETLRRATTPVKSTTFNKPSRSAAPTSVGTQHQAEEHTHADARRESALMSSRKASLRMLKWAVTNGIASLLTGDQ